MVKWIMIICHSEQTLYFAITEQRNFDDGLIDGQSQHWWTMKSPGPASAVFSFQKFSDLLLNRYFDWIWFSFKLPNVDDCYKLDCQNPEKRTEKTSCTREVRKTMLIAHVQHHFIVAVSSTHLLLCCSILRSGSTRYKKYFSLFWSIIYISLSIPKSEWWL